jgi:hypothetical protein
VKTLGKGFDVARDSGRSIIALGRGTYELSDGLVAFDGGLRLIAGTTLSGAIDCAAEPPDTKLVVPHTGLRVEGRLRAERLSIQSKSAPMAAINSQGESTYGVVVQSGSHVHLVSVFVQADPASAGERLRRCKPRVECYFIGPSR